MNKLPSTLLSKRSFIRSFQKLHNNHNSKCNVSKRMMGGGGHHQPEPQSMKARLWEGHNTKPEGWETPVYATYAAATVLITLALGFAPDTTIQTWASNEARVRLDLQEEGKLDQPIFGVHYNVPEKVFDWECPNPDNPFNEEDDEDEDDDE